MLDSLSEAQFRIDLLIPLLTRIGCKNVRERHGPEEYGKDITFSEVSPLGTTYVAVVAKVGNISGAASGVQNLNTVLNQVNMAFEMDYEDIETKQKHRINRVIVWTTGKIANNAEKRIISSSSDQYRNIEFKDGQATIELIEQYYTGFFTIRDPYISDYFAASKEHFSHIEELRTLGYSSDRQRLPTIFVPPIFTPYDRSKPKHRPTQKPHEIKIKKTPFIELEERKENTLIIGEAGTGKTTLLRRLFLHIIEVNEQKMSKTPIPILIEIKKLDFGEEKDCITKAIREAFIRFSPTGLAPELSSNLSDGSFVILLDGLDELVSEEQIKTVILLIEDYSNRFPGNRLVITSRTHEILDDPTILPGFKVYQVNNLDIKQMESFIENWFGDNIQISGKLKKFISSPIALHGLPATPLVLSLIAILFETGNKEIPANLTELFQKYTELALGRWDVSKDISQQFEWRIKEFILRRISWELIQQHKVEINYQDLKRISLQSSSDRGLKIDPDLFFKEVISRSELLVQNDEGDYEFKHRVFRDYFCGLEINSLPDPKSFVTNKLLDGEWFYSIFFASGLQPDSEDYLRIALDLTGESIEKQLPYAYTLGLLAQSKYLAPLAIKIEAVKSILDLLIENWDKTVNWIQENQRDFDKENIEITHFMLLFFYLAWPSVALGSITLVQALSEIVKEYVGSLGEFTSDQETIREWKTFFLSVACIQCDNVESVLSIYESRIITDPLFWLIGSVMIDEMVKKTWLNNEDIERLKKLSKKLKRKWGKQKKYLTEIFKSTPIPLLQSSNS